MSCFHYIAVRSWLFPWQFCWPLSHEIKMKLFQLVQKYYQTIGVHATQTHPKCAFNVHNFWLLLITSAFCASTVMSFIQSTAIMDYAESFYIFSTTLASMTSYLEAISKAKTTFTFISELDEYIQKSGLAFNMYTNRKSAMHQSILNFHHLESQNVSTETVLAYSKLIGNIELMTKVIRFGLVELTVVGCFFPALVITLINYFYFDLGDESYFLSFPIR